MIAWRVFDMMRTIDWIGTRPELDSKRVGGLTISARIADAALNTGDEQTPAMSQEKTDG